MTTLSLFHFNSFETARVVVVMFLLLLGFVSHFHAQIIDKMETVSSNEGFLEIGTGYIETKGREPRHTFFSKEAPVSNVTKSMLSSINFSAP